MPLTSLSDITLATSDHGRASCLVLPGSLPCILTSRFAFGIWHSYSSSETVFSSKDWLNPGDNDCGDLDNDGNRLTASSIVEGPFLPMRKKPDARGPYLVIKTNITMVETTNGRFRGFRRICFSPNNEHFEFC